MSKQIAIDISTSGVVKRGISLLSAENLMRIVEPAHRALIEIGKYVPVINQAVKIARILYKLGDFIICHFLNDNHGDRRLAERAAQKVKENENEPGFFNYLNRMILLYRTGSEGSSDSVGEPEPDTAEESSEESKDLMEVISQKLSSFLGIFSCRKKRGGRKRRMERGTYYVDKSKPQRLNSDLYAPGQTMC